MAATHGTTVVLLLFLGNMLTTDSKVLLPEANVSCIVHDDCILPCSFRPTGSVVIHWYKQQIPVHSFYYNKDQFGLQNKHFSGRTCLFNSHIPHGNASLLLRRVKVQDKGRYKCYTSTRKGNQEIFLNLEVKALIQSVIMELTDRMVTCSSQNVYPIPQVTWATDPPSAQEALQNSTIKTTDHKGLFTVESTLRIVGNHSDWTYFCSFTSADRTQVWTASRKNQENTTQEEGRTLCIPCIAPHSPQNFSLFWTFTSSREPTVILRYDSRHGHIFNLWEGRAELDPDQLLLGNGSLLLHKPDSEEHSGTYTCTFSGLQSRHVVQTTVNITVASLRVREQRVQRSWWSTAAAGAFVLFTIIVAVPQCVRQTGLERASQRHSRAGLTGFHKDRNTASLYINGQHREENSRLQLESEAEDDRAVSTPESTDDCTLTVPPTDDTERVGQPVGPLVEEKTELQSSSQDQVESENTEPMNLEQDIE